MRLIKRYMEPVLLQLSQQYPVITITGPRQSGKTTLVKKIFAHKKYYNLETPDQRELALSDPRAFINNIKDGAILNEIQQIKDIYITNYRTIAENFFTI